MQIIKYTWQDWKPNFLVKEGEKTIKWPLLGEEIKIRLGCKFCIGYFRDGRHFDCANKRMAEEHQCNECKLEDDYFFCIRCTGSECANTKKRHECEKSYYFVYLAAFGPLLKVGISHEFRILERLVEQGADFGAKIARIQDGKMARMIEQKIKNEIGITDRVTGKQKNDSIFSDPNVCVANIFKAVSMLKTSCFSKHLFGPEIHDLRNYYNLQNIHIPPFHIEADEGAILDGRITAAKGNLLVINTNGRFFSVNASHLIGREIEKLEENEAITI
jgi:hypothetical protein